MSTSTCFASRIAAPLLLSLLAAAAAGLARAADDVHTIELTQTGCQFLEAENGKDHQFQPQSADDCREINAKSGDARLAAAAVLRLKPGHYAFQVTNADVPYELGFWLRSQDYNRQNPLHKLTKTSISGGGLNLGQSKTYEVELKPGEYLYSCPLNPTLDYRIVVAG